jgi:hypothetical protein
MEKDFLQATLKETNVDYWNLKANKDILSVENNKLQRDYKNMEFEATKGVGGAHNGSW